MFKTIVWATDGSELADRALPLVKELAHEHESKVVIVHANEILAGRFGGAPLLADEDDIRARFAAQAAELKDAGFEVELMIKTGIDGVAALIAHAADEVEADLIVVGTHGRGAVAGALLGSVAKGLLHIAKCPVLVVTPARVPAEAVPA